jgi:SAM-dependent methyltransferase
MLPLDRFILPELDPGAQILDLCCGTGQTAAMLTEHGYEVTGIDGSESMLVFARENAPDAAFIAGDARTFSMPDRFDAVVCQYDSLNHILSVEELLSVFSNVHDALMPGGVFLFDLNTEEGYLQRWRATSIGHVEDDHAYITHPTYDRETRTGSYNVAMFFLKDGVWERTDATLLARCHSEEEVLGGLEAAGFSDRKVYGAESDLGMEAPGRNFYFARKG